MSETTEKAIIGSIAADDARAMPHCVSRAVGIEWFTTPHCRTLYSAAAHRFSKGQFIDIASLLARTSTAGREVPEDYLIQCIDSCTPAYIESYVDDLENDFLLRQVGRLAESHRERAKETDPAQVSTLIAECQAQWCRIGLRRFEAPPLGDVADRLITAWENPSEKAHDITWPIDCLQRGVGSLTDELIYIAARESVGKTALALQFCNQLAFAGTHTSLASLESKRPKIVQRLIAQVGQVNTLRLRRGQASTELYQRAREAAAKIKLLPLDIADHGMTVEQLYAYGRAQKAQGSRLLVLDNMKHLRPSRKYGSVVEQFRDYSAQLKWLRDDLDLPVIVLHHLNDKLNLSWSDDINRDADIIIVLSENEGESIPSTPDNQWSGRNIVDIEVRKNREGRRNFRVQAEFKTDVQTFCDWPPKDDEQEGED